MKIKHDKKLEYSGQLHEPLKELKETLPEAFQNLNAWVDTFESVRHKLRVTDADYRLTIQKQEDTNALHSILSQLNLEPSFHIKTLYSSFVPQSKMSAFDNYNALNRIKREHTESCTQNYTVRIASGTIPEFLRMVIFTLTGRQ